MNNKVEKCNFYNDHDCSVPECDEILDERFLPVYTCDERIDCAYKKYSSCIFFQNGDCGMCRVEDGGEYYFDGLAKCDNNPNCYYKQLLAEQAKNKKLVEALELALSDTCYDAKTCEYKCQFAILNQCDLFKAGQALNEVKK